MSLMPNQPYRQNKNSLCMDLKEATRARASIVIAHDLSRLKILGDDQLRQTAMVR
jgi:hypothetical protein